MQPRLSTNTAALQLFQPLKDALSSALSHCVRAGVLLGLGRLIGSATAASTTEEYSQQCIHPFLCVRVYVCCWDQAGDKKGSTWEHILKADDFKRRSFSDIDRNNDGFVDAKVSLQQKCIMDGPPTSLPDRLPV